MKEVMFSKPAKLAGSYDVVVCGGALQDLSLQSQQQNKVQ